MNDSKRRNRLGNFDQDDIELFLNLVDQNKSLIDSGKQEDKKKGWENIEENFNASCTGIKRDIGALKMKLKNLKALNKRNKLDESVVERLEEAAESEQDNETPAKGKTTRKRSKVWTTEETEQLSELIATHFHCLNTSLTREALELRSQAWDAILEDFNRSKPSSAQRDINELKIKLKNLKAKRTNFKSEGDSGNPPTELTTYIEVEEVQEEGMRLKRSKPQTSTPVVQYETAQVRNSRSTVPALSRQATKYKTYEVILDSLDPVNDYSDDDDLDYSPPPPKKPSLVAPSPAKPAEDKEEARIRKENLLLKNSVLRKKERLLELQISLAERTLRRHQLQ